MCSACFFLCVSVFILVSFFVSSRAMASSSFTVHPRCSLAQREFVSEGRVWEGFEIDLSRFYYHGYSAMVDPFHDDVVRSSTVVGCDEFDDYFRGRGCEMSVDEWACFCRRVLALEDPIPQTMDAFVSLVDETIISVVRAVVGVGPYSSGSRLMSIVVVFVQLLMLMGGMNCCHWSWLSFVLGILMLALVGRLTGHVGVVPRVSGPSRKR